MKSAIEKIQEMAAAPMARNELLAAERIEGMLSGKDKDGKLIPDRPWSEVTVADKMALAFAGFSASRVRAKINAHAAPKTLGVIVVPSQITSAADWEARGRALAAQGRKVIDTTAGPAEIAEPEKGPT